MEMGMEMGTAGGGRIDRRTGEAFMATARNAFRDRAELLEALAAGKPEAAVAGMRQDASDMHDQLKRMTANLECREGFDELMAECRPDVAEYIARIRAARLKIESMRLRRYEEERRRLHPRKTHVWFVCSMADGKAPGDVLRFSSEAHAREAFARRMKRIGVHFLYESTEECLEFEIDRMPFASHDAVKVMQGVTYPCASGSEEDA